MKGTLYGVGVGPGDPELMTLKAVRLIRENKIIAVPGAERYGCLQDCSAGSTGTGRKGTSSHLYAHDS